MPPITPAAMPLPPAAKEALRPNRSLRPVCPTRLRLIAAIAGVRSAAAEAVQDFGREHRQLEREYGERERGQHHGGNRGTGSQAFIGHGIDDGARWDLARDTGDGAQGQREADLHLRPLVRC